jgi:hypothetical protein
MGKNFLFLFPSPSVCMEGKRDMNLAWSLARHGLALHGMMVG